MQKDGMKELVSIPAYPTLNTVGDVKMTKRSKDHLSSSGKQKIVNVFKNNSTLQGAIDQIAKTLDSDPDLAYFFLVV